jgi:hypothetical protein
MSTPPRTPPTALAPSVYLRNDQGGTLVGGLTISAGPNPNPGGGPWDPTLLQVGGALTVTTTAVNFTGDVAIGASVYRIRRQFIIGPDPFTPIFGYLRSQGGDPELNTFSTDPIDGSGEFIPPAFGIYRMRIVVKAMDNPNLVFGSVQATECTTSSGWNTWILDETFSASTSITPYLNSPTAIDTITVVVHFLGSL